MCRKIQTNNIDTRFPAVVAALRKPVETVARPQQTRRNPYRSKTNQNRRRIINS